MTFRGMKCGIGDHLLKGRGVLISNPRHINFVKKMYPSFRAQEKVCEECKRIMERAYYIKYQRAIRLRQTQSLSSVSESKTSTSNGTTSVEHSQTQVASNDQSVYSSSGDDRDQPTTSRQAASKRTRQDDENMAGINVLRGLRCPDIQPAPKRQQFVNVNPDIMKIYNQSIMGG